MGKHCKTCRCPDSVYMDNRGHMWERHGDFVTYTGNWSRWFVRLLIEIGHR